MINLQEKESLLECSLDSMTTPISIYQAIRGQDGEIVDFEIVFANDAQCEANGLSKNDQIGKKLYEVFPGLDEDLREAHRRVTEEGAPVSLVQSTYHRPTGEGRQVITFDINLVQTGDGFTAIWRDTSEERQEKLEMMFSSERDPLTGLVNRTALFRRLDEVVAEASRYNSPAMLLFLDLDHFKALNDSEGHMRGDNALRDIANVVRDRIRESDIAARVGGDEIAVVLRHSGIDEAMAVAEDIRSLTEQKFSRTAHPLTLSIGVASIEPYSLQDAEMVFRAADEAMYRAKSAGGNQVMISPRPIINKKQAAEQSA